MAKINKKEFYNQVEKLLEDMKENNSYSEDSLSKLLKVDKETKDLILYESPSDFFQDYKINQIQDNLIKEFNATTIKNLVNNENSWQVAINMKNGKAWLMDSNSYIQNQDVKYFSLPSLKDYEYDNLSEIRMSLKDGYHPILNENNKFYLESELKETFEELKIAREDREQEIEEEDNSYDFDR